MAIIKCPECGHQISDKAPVCPSCGVEIAGKIEKCPYCGEVYFKSEGVCPHCHKAPYTVPNDAVPQTLKKLDADNDLVKDNQTETTDVNENPDVPETPEKKEYGKHTNRTVLIISVILAVIVLGVCAYVYNRAQDNNEEEQYEIAMNSNDPMVLQSYLDNFKDAPQEHIDSINAHLERINAQDQEWTNALVSNSKAALTAYLNSHPDSPHRAEALNKIDSIDWAQCSKINTAEAYQTYIDNHMDGNHYDEAQLALKKLQSTVVSPAERQAVIGAFRQFFMSINAKEESTLASTVSDVINFLGKSTATKDDIISFMHKLYKPEVTNLVWSISKDFNIQKTEVSDGVYEFTASFLAEQKVTKNDNTTTTTQYRITGKIDSDGKISDMSMTKIIQ